MSDDDHRTPRAAARAEATTPAEQSFARRVLIGVGIAVGVAGLALFLWYALYVLLLAFAAVLVGVLLRGSGEWTAGRLSIPVGGALVLVLVISVGCLVVLGYFAAPSIVQQAENLADRLPQSLRKAEQSLRGYTWGRRILGDQDPPPSGGAATPSAAATQPAATLPASPATQPAGETAGGEPTLVARVMEAGSGPAVVRRATQIANRLLQGLLALFVVLVSGIYLAVQPRMYVRGLLMLAPHARRQRYHEVLGRLASVLRWWMIGQLVPMAVIGSLTAVGLTVIGVELWLILGLLAALFNFIPNFGPLISGVPAFLLALSESPTKALWVVALFICAQSLEGYVLTPLVQRKAVELPPALLILFQVLAGLLLGAVGVILAAPLLAVIVVAVKMLYVEDVLGDHPHLPGHPGHEGGAKPQAAVV
jgi:predicted PurR-regulated permease PerM